MEMDKKISVKICCGTYCHVMGGADLQMPEEIIPAHLLKDTDFRYSTCMGRCREQAKPPYAEINGTIMEEASKEKIVTELENIYKAVNYEGKQ